MIKDGWKKKYSLVEFMQSDETRLLFLLNAEVFHATVEFYKKYGLHYTIVPSTTGAVSSPTEPGSDSSPVTVCIGNYRTNLIDSAQFYLEYACRLFSEGCYYIGHSFRYEKPDSRHLAQFWHSEAEITGDLSNVQRLVEEYIRFITNELYHTFYNQLNEVPDFRERINGLLARKEPFRKIQYREAVDYLSSFSDGLTSCDTGALRITAKGEKRLMEEFGEFTWVERWDKMSVPFYQALDESKELALNADLLFGVGEVVGAGQRHYSSSSLKSALYEHGLSEREYSWYIAMKETAPMLTSGFGMGIERYLMWFLGINDIRDLELYPRNQYQIGLF